MHVKEAENNSVQSSAYNSRSNMASQIQLPIHSILGGMNTMQNNPILQQQSIPRFGSPMNPLLYQSLLFSNYPGVPSSGSAYNLPLFLPPPAPPILVANDMLFNQLFNERFNIGNQYEPAISNYFGLPYHPNALSEALFLAIRKLTDSSGYDRPLDECLHVFTDSTDYVRLLYDPTYMSKIGAVLQAEAAERRNCNASGPECSAALGRKRTLGESSNFTNGQKAGNNDAKCSKYIKTETEKGDTTRKTSDEASGSASMWKKRNFTDNAAFASKNALESAKRLSDALFHDASIYRNATDFLQAQSSIYQPALMPVQTQSQLNAMQRARNIHKAGIANELKQTRLPFANFSVQPIAPLLQTEASVSASHAALLGNLLVPTSVTRMVAPVSNQAPRFARFLPQNGGNFKSSVQHAPFYQSQAVSVPRTTEGKKYI